MGDGSAGTPIGHDRNCMASILLTAFLGPAPVQTPGGFVVQRLKEIGADRLCKCWVIQQDSDIVSSLFAGAFPASANFRSIFIIEMNAVVGCVLGITRISRNQ